MNDIMMIWTSAPTTYAAYTKAAITMQAAAEASKLRITLTTKVHERALAQVARPRPLVSQAQLTADRRGGNRWQTSSLT